MKTTPKDFFLHLGATVALYVTAGALINLAFSVINYYNPDALAGYFYGNSVAWPISIVIVLVPILYFLEWFINRDLSKMPEKADLWIRRWRIYLTLFLAVILMAGDLITLINTYLNGEITSRLVYKVIVVLLVAGAIGKYYFFSLYPNFRWAKFARRTNAWVGIIMVLAAIILGFITVGSPATQRALRFDSQRISDLQNIQWQIINHWQQKGKLPVTLNELNDSLSGIVIPSDPETKTNYEYDTRCEAGDINEIVSCQTPLTFDLCATFSRASQNTKGRGEFGRGGMSYPSYDMSYPYPGPDGNDVWKHESGKACFIRTIDPEKYPINKAS